MRVAVSSAPIVISRMKPPKIRLACVSRPGVAAGLVAERPLRHQRQQTEADREAQKRAQSNDRTPSQHRQQQRHDRRQRRLAEIAGEIIDAERPARLRAVAVGHQHRGARMLDARPEPGEDEPDAKPGEAERQGHDQKSSRRDEGRQGQGCPRTERSDEAVARHLQPAHGAVVERTKDCEPGIGQAELPIATRATARRADRCSRRATHAPGRRRLRMARVAATSRPSRRLCSVSTVNRARHGVQVLPEWRNPRPVSFGRLDC